VRLVAAARHARFELPRNKLNAYHIEYLYYTYVDFLIKAPNRRHGGPGNTGMSRRPSRTGFQPVQIRHPLAPARPLAATRSPPSLLGGLLPDSYACPNAYSSGAGGEKGTRNRGRKI
jgi:hypothetical protein